MAIIRADALRTTALVINALIDDGYEWIVNRSEREQATIAESIRLAADNGCLMWTPDRIVSTLDGHRLDLRPDRD